MKFFLASLSVFYIYLLSLTTALAQEHPHVPDALLPWVDWVQRDHVEDPCVKAGSRKYCYFAQSAQIDLREDGAAFEVEVLIRLGTVLELPGGGTLWPQDVRVNGRAVPVLKSNSGVPYVQLSPGQHRIKGVIPWSVEPSAIPLPKTFGLASVTKQGEALQARFSSSGELLLDAATAEERGVANRIDIQVYRQIVDGVPLRLETRLALKVSGQPRVERITGALLDGFEALDFSSDLTGRIDQNGKLILQVKPGEWAVSVTSIRTQKNDAITLGTFEQPWPDNEIWVLQQDPRIRQLTLSGGQTIDPNQTELPGDWRDRAAYRVESGSTVQLDTASDLQIAAPDQLRLVRRARLNFDGSGYEITDTITGTIRQSKRIDSNDALELGSARIDRAPQIITRNTALDKSGLQVQQGPLVIETESRVETSAANYLMNGWDHRFEDVETYIDLPPNYTLITAFGVDSTRGAWLDKWELLDIFLVILVAAAVARLYGVWLGLFSLLGMMVVHLYFQAFAVYFLIVIGLATLYAIIPAGKVKSLFQVLKYGALLLVFLQVAPFSLEQAKEAMFPQLKSQFSVPMSASSRLRNESYLGSEVAPSLNRRSKTSSNFSDKMLLEQDLLGKRGLEKVVTQTGFGISDWQGQTVRLIWHGEVPPDLTAKLILLGPNANLAVGMLKAIIPLLILMIVVLRPANLTGGWSAFGNAGTKVASLLLPLSLGLGMMNASPVQAQDAITSSQAELARDNTTFPPEYLLEDLRRHLKEQREDGEAYCAQSCSEIARLDLDVGPQHFSYEMEVHAVKPSLVALPVTIDTWRPETLQLSGATSQAHYLRQGKFIYIVVDAGVTHISAHGRPPATDRFDVAFSQVPNRVDIQTTGWTDFGLSEDGSLAGTLQFIKDKSDEESDEDAGLTGDSDIAPFFRLSRLLTLDYSWTVANNIQLLSPAGQAVQLRVPLLEGEAVTSANVRIEDGHAIINIAPGTTEVSWLSILAQAPDIRLQAAQNGLWAEDWSVISNNTWDLTFSGIEPLMDQDEDAGRTFRPWPGEVLEIGVIKPPSAGGQTKTIAQVNNSIRQGLRNVHGELTLDLQTSTAGTHVFSFPPQAHIAELYINDVRQTILFADGDLSTSFAPGQHQIKIVWEMPRSLATSLSTPEINLNFPASNVVTRYQLPASRWVLWAQGQGVGPAILIWSTLPIWLLLAVALSRLPFAGLRWPGYFLLFLGLTQSHYIMSFVVVGFILAVHLSGSRNHFEKHPILHNLRQIALIFWSAIATGCLLVAIYLGFDDWPNMMVEGPGSSLHLFSWYLDQSDGMLPVNTIYSLPLLAYRVVMLLWALWLALRIIRWLPEGWHNFSKWGVFRPLDLSRRQTNAPATSAEE